MYMPHPQASSGVLIWEMGLSWIGLAFPVIRALQPLIGLPAVLSGPWFPPIWLGGRGALALRARFFLVDGLQADMHLALSMLLDW